MYLVTLKDKGTVEPSEWRGIVYANSEGEAEEKVWDYWEADKDTVEVFNVFIMKTIGAAQ